MLSSSPWSSPARAGQTRSATAMHMRVLPLACVCSAQCTVRSDGARRTSASARATHHANDFLTVAPACGGASTSFWCCCCCCVSLGSTYRLSCRFHIFLQDQPRIAKTRKYSGLPLRNATLFFFYFLAGLADIFSVWTRVFRMRRTGYAHKRFARTDENHIVRCLVVERKWPRGSWLLAPAPRSEMVTGPRGRSKARA